MNRNKRARYQLPLAVALLGGLGVILISCRNEAVHQRIAQNHEFQDTADHGTNRAAAFYPRDLDINEFDPRSLNQTNATDWSPELNLRFRQWIDLFQAAEPVQRQTLVEQGAALARARRPQMLDLIRRDPKRALSEAVPLHLLADLPGEVRKYVEAPVSGVAESYVISNCSFVFDENAGLTPPVPLLHEVKLNDRSYRAHFYADRLNSRSKSQIPVYGIALDDEVAVYHSPVYRLKPEDLESALTLFGSSARGLEDCRSPENRLSKGFRP